MLRYAAILARGNRVDDALYAELAARFSNDELVDLAPTVGFSAFVSRMHAMFQTDLGQATFAQIGAAVACALPAYR